MPWQGAVRIQWQLTFTVQRPPLTGVGRGSPPGVAPQLRGGQQGLPGALWRREVEASGHSVSGCGAFCWRGCSWSRQDWPGVDAPRGEECVVAFCGDRGVLGGKGVAVPRQARRAQAERAASDSTAACHHRSEEPGVAWPRGRPAARAVLAKPTRWRPALGPREPLTHCLLLPPPLVSLVRHVGGRCYLCLQLGG